MKIDPQTRTATLGVRELSEFEICRRSAGRPSGRWRMETGRLWHQTLQKESESDFERERVVSGQIERGGWTLRVEGRCDLFRSTGDGRPVFGEIKTVTDPLPLAASELRARFPAYFRQLATYLLLSGETEKIEASFLLFLNIDTGIRQSVPCEPSDFEQLENHLESLVEFLVFTSGRAEARARLAWKSFRDHPRSGQIEASEALARAESSHRFVGFQAPTGFGKTRIVLEHALEAIRDGKADRILYLTGKTSGQEQACLEARNLFPDSAAFPSYRMRNHREHWAACPVDGCLPDQCAPLPDEGTNLPIAELVRHPGHAQDAWNGVVQMAENFHFCPYSLSRGILPFSDLWIADYNYLFSPSSRHIFSEQPGFDPSRTWLLIDEAHNLPDRASAALGGRLDVRLLENAAEDLAAFRTDNSLRTTLRELAREIQNLPTEKPIDSASFYVLTDLLESASDAMASQPLPWRELSGDTLATLQGLESALFLIEKEELDPLLWSPATGRLEWLPMRIGPWIAEILQPYAQTVFFSATLDPFSSFVANFGLETDRCQLVHAESGGADRFRTAIDTRIGTTLRERGRNASRTAETLRELAETRGGCLAAFFPSFEYANTLHTYLEAVAPHLRCIVQPRDLDADEREHFARTAPLSHDILLLMLGGSFAEAVDAFGGVVETAVIVGPGLPELSTLNRIRMDKYPSREEGFHEVCRIPGMRRVNQAIGRLVRSLDHRATILLHDRRFLEPEYHELLRNDLGQIEIIRNEDDWRRWISGNG